MTIRMPFPADCNDTTARFKRTLDEAFPCDAARARATQSFPARKRRGRWLAVAALGVLVIILAGCSNAEAQQSSASISAAELKRAAAEAWNCPGMHAVWLDETTVQCLNYLP